MKIQAKETVKNVILCAVIILVSCVQFAFGKFIMIGSASACLMLPLLIVIAMQKDIVPAVILGAIGGVATDMFSSANDGFYSVFFVLMSFVVAELMVFKLRHTFAAAALFSAGFSLLLNVLYWLLFIFFKGYDDGVLLLVGKYLPSAIYTALLIIVFYPVSLIFKKKPLYE